MTSRGRSILGVSSVLAGCLAAVCMRDLLFALADSSSRWEHVLNIVILPGVLASRMLRNDAAAGINLVLFTVLFAVVFFVAVRSLCDLILRRRAGGLQGK